MRRLNRVCLSDPIFLITTCTFDRRPLLTNEFAATVIIDEWNNSRSKHGWVIGRYVIIPDHVHFFCRPSLVACSLSVLMGFWKEWTSKRILRQLKMEAPLWQPGFHDYILRSSESYSQKWIYVFQNPERAELVKSAHDWKWQGEIEVIGFD